MAHCFLEQWITFSQISHLLALFFKRKKKHYLEKAGELVREDLNCEPVLKTKFSLKFCYDYHMQFFSFDKYFK